MSGEVLSRRVRHLLKKLPSSLLIILVLAASLYSYLSLFENALIDDAFIAMQYAKTLLASGTWGFLPNHVSNSATSPLNVMLLAAIAFITGSIPGAVKWLTLINFLIIFILLRRISVKYLNTEIFGLLAFTAIVVNPLLLSTIGLEGILLTTLFIGSVYLYLQSKWSLLAVSTGLLTLTRPEGILFFAVFLAFVPTMKLRFKVILLYLACLAPWAIFSWVYLGSLIPDTFFIKTLQNSWGPWDFSNGLLLYYKKYPLETILSFVYLPLVVLAFNRFLRNPKIVMIIGLAGLAHFAGYSLLKIPPYHWYYVPQVIAIILLGALALTGHYLHCVQAWPKHGLRILIAAYAFIPVLGMVYILNRDGFFLKEMPIHTNWATHEQYQQVGVWLKQHNPHGPIQSGRECGTLAFYCNCDLRNDFSDRSWLTTYITRHTQDSGIKAALLNINFVFFQEDASNFSPEAAVSIEHARKDLLDNPQLVKWNASTKWIPDGLVTYHEGSANLTQKLHLVNPTEYPYVFTYIWNNGQTETYLLDDASYQGRAYNIEWTVTPQKILFDGAFLAKQSSIKTLSPGPYLAVAVAFSDSRARATQHIFERRFWFGLTGEGQLKIFLPPQKWQNLRWPDELGWEMKDIDQVMQDR